MMYISFRFYFYHSLGIHLFVEIKIVIFENRGASRYFLVWAVEEYTDTSHFIRPLHFNVSKCTRTYNRLPFQQFTRKLKHTIRF